MPTACQATSARVSRSTVATSWNEPMRRQPVGLGHPHALEHGCRRSARSRSACLPSIFVAVKPGVPAPHEEALDLVVGGVPGPDHDDVGEGGVADPALGAVQHPACRPSRRGGGAQAAGGVGAGQRLGQAEGADELAAAPSAAASPRAARPSRRRRSSPSPGRSARRRRWRGTGRPGASSSADPAAEHGAVLEPRASRPARARTGRARRSAGPGACGNSARSQ